MVGVALQLRLAGVETRAESLQKLEPGPRFGAKVIHEVGNGLCFKLSLVSETGSVLGFGVPQDLGLSLPLE